MPEKSLSEIPRALRELYEKGVAAWERQNWDYAIAILSQVLQKEPAFFDCRRTLRVCQHKKAEANKGFLKRFFGSASNSPLLAKGQILLRNNPLEALQIAEQILNGDPNSTSAHKLLAEAALELDLPKTAVLSLEIARKQAPTDKEIALRLGEALSKAGQVAKAEQVYRELERSYPNDQTIVQALKNVVASRTMVEGGYDALASAKAPTAIFLRTRRRRWPSSKNIARSKRKTSRIELSWRMRPAWPTNPAISNCSGTSPNSTFKRETSIAPLSSTIASSKPKAPTIPRLNRAVSEITARKFDQALTQLSPDSPTYTEDKAKIEADKLAYRLAEAKRRVDRYPNDLQLRFELGQLYFRAGRLSEAILELQRAQTNPHIRIPALKHLGQCFAQRGMNDMAARTFQTALKDKVGFDDEKKELTYQLGSVLEKMGKKDEAIEYFKQIYEVDIGYLDVAAKVDDYYSGK